MNYKATGYPRWSRVLAPYSRAELPGWSRVLSKAGVLVDIYDRRWEQGPTVTIRGKDHGFLMRLDLSDWAQRMTYFLGRYYELGVLRLLDAILRPGDAVVDVGANIGMITLHARHVVGPTGRIDCFEPNPECRRLLEGHLALNRIENATVHACALADARGTLALNLTSNHSGTATFATVDEVQRSFEVDVRVGDEVLGDRPVQLIKVDVEGFELKVLLGLRDVLARQRPLVITELIESQLTLAGTNSTEISTFFRELGFEAYGIGVARRGLRQTLRLSRELACSSDALWIHPDHPMGAELKRFLAK